MARLTKSFIDQIHLPSIKPNGAATQAFYRDEILPGFGVRVGSGGTKTFFIERRINGRVKRISIGRYGFLTPAQARTKAQEMLGEIALGNDPAAKKKALEAKNITLNFAFKDYITTRKNLKPGTVANYNKCMNGCFPSWLDKRLVDITKEMVEKRHLNIGSRAPARANNAMRVLRAVFNHSIAKYEDDTGRPVLASNPVDRISQVRAWYKIERRRTLIAAHELKGWYQVTLSLTYDVTRDYLHFLLFTGLRKMEAATLSWDQVCFKSNTFTILDTKNGEPHTLPLTGYLHDLLLHRKKYSTNEWVFPSPLHSGKHLSEPRGATKVISEAMGRKFILHDLRRTFITIAESLDIPAYALKRLINHRDPNDVTAGYIISSVDRIRTPMGKIERFILDQIKGDPTP